MTKTHTGPARQRGAALLAAMMIVTLVVTLAAAMVWQQWRAVQVETAERARTQAAWILYGALDWARLILREDARSGRPTALTEPWATPLAESRLSTFLAADNTNAEGAPEAFLSGSITDAQSRYNLTNLTDADKTRAASELATLQRLCQTIGLSDDVAQRIASGLRSAAGTTGTSANASTSPSDSTPLRPRNVAQLSWLGLDASSIQQLQPYVTLLPISTLVNVNTAPREVLAAVIPNLDLASAERLVQQRQRTPFKTPDEVSAQLPSPPTTPITGMIGVKSDFFEVRGKLRLEDRILEQLSLIQRRGIDVVVVQREQVSTRETDPSLPR